MWKEQEDQLLLAQALSEEEVCERSFPTSRSLWSLSGWGRTTYTLLKGLLRDSNIFEEDLGGG